MHSIQIFNYKFKHSNIQFNKFINSYEGIKCIKFLSFYASIFASKCSFHKFIHHSFHNNIHAILHETILDTFYQENAIRVISNIFSSHYKHHLTTCHQMLPLVML